MKDGQGRPGGRDPDTRRGITKALQHAFRGDDLLIDHAADAAFASSIRRLGGVPGTKQ